MTVKLQDPDGKPLTDVLVSGIVPFRLSVVPIKAAECPIFALDPERPREVLFLHPERKLAAMVTVRGDEKVAPTVQLAPCGVVTGRVLDHGKPVSARNLDLHFVDALAPRSHASCEVPGTDGRTPPTKEGRFRIEGVLPGMKFDVVVYENGRVAMQEKKTENKPAPVGRDRGRGRPAAAN